MTAATKLRYLEEIGRLELEAVILELGRDGDDEWVVLDETVFYPQGGGQPFDTGWIESAKGRFRVGEVRWLEELVRHRGQFESGSFDVGEPVHCRVDPPRRALHSRLHSAGHIVDMAATDLGLSWTPAKGYHFPQGPYVEYRGTVAPDERERLRSEIESRANELVSSGIETSIRWMPADEARGAGQFVPDFVDGSERLRVVFYGSFGVPCGGTHVPRLEEVGPIRIRKIRQSGEAVRVSYELGENRL